MATLSAFIRTNREQILEDWEAFARTLPIGAAMNVKDLRDHAAAMLDAIAADLETTQSSGEQFAKATGAVESDLPGAPTAAGQHGTGRAESGFTVIQMIAEFRALRASVVRLWTAHKQMLGPSELTDIVRFNEAIDQAVAESLVRYTSEIDETRERFLARPPQDDREQPVTPAQF